jgi:hypothetical protein
MSASQLFMRVSLVLQRVATDRDRFGQQRKFIAFVHASDLGRPKGWFFLRLPAEKLVEAIVVIRPASGAFRLEMESLGVQFVMPPYAAISHFISRSRIALVLLYILWL